MQILEIGKKETERIEEKVQKFKKKKRNKDIEVSLFACVC